MLSRSHRLCSRKDFLLCYNKGEKLITTHYILFAYSTQLPVWRLGVTVTRKIGNAVLRNKFRRIIRAFFRKYAESLHTGYDFVVISRYPLLLERLVLSSVEREITPVMQMKHYITL